MKCLIHDTFDAACFACWTGEPCPVCYPEMSLVPQEDIPGVLLWIEFVGGSLDGTKRPIALHGHPLEAGSTYNRFVPNDETWTFDGTKFIQTRQGRG